MADLALPDDYASLLAGLKQRVRQARYRTQRLVNIELIELILADRQGARRAH